MFVNPEPPPNPAYDEADRAAVRRHNVELLTRMNDAASEWAIGLLQQPKPEDPAEAAKIGATFDRILRAVRRTILLIDKLIDPARQPTGDPPPHRDRDHRGRDPDDDDDDDGQPSRERIDRLDRPEKLETLKDDCTAFADWTEAQLLAGLCEGIGLDLIDETGKPRTLEQLVAIYGKAHVAKYKKARSKPPDSS
jgi:hypothetical protein